MAEVLSQVTQWVLCHTEEARGSEGGCLEEVTAQLSLRRRIVRKRWIEAGEMERGR